MTLREKLIENYTSSLDEANPMPFIKAAGSKMAGWARQGWIAGKGAAQRFIANPKVQQAATKTKELAQKTGSYVKDKALHQGWKGKAQLGTAVAVPAGAYALGKSKGRKEAGY